MDKNQHMHRVDELLVKKGLSETRSQAQALIKDGKVRLGDAIITKASKRLPKDAPLELIDRLPYVSRSGLKLEAFLDNFAINVSDKICLDVGASTGGFTDCLLQRNAKEVICVDVGHSQLHPKISTDSRVTNIEKLNARTMSAKDLPYKSFDLITIDVSFISLRKVLPNIWQFLKKEGHLIALVKPQFEATKAIMDKEKGVIKDQETSSKILKDILDFCSKEFLDSKIIGHIPSPIKGSAGNQEYVLGLIKA